jgi:hypothetical protein
MGAQTVGLRSLAASTKTAGDTIVSTGESGKRAL